MVKKEDNLTEVKKVESDISDVRLSDGEISKQKVENVGEEFMKWAEQYWALEKIITNGFGDGKNGAESCPYSYIREIFVNKINELSCER
jgi:hypothetical protein